MTVVTGALGAGKTTLLNATLERPDGRRLAVIVNEFGDVGLDGYLLGDRPFAMLELTAGCLCCSVRGELDDALERVAGDGDVDHLLVETTGVADPGPVIESVARRPDLLALNAVVCVVDARNLLTQLRDPRRSQIARQIELASTITLSKTDLAGPGRTIAVRERITALNPLADVHVATRGQLPIAALLDADAFAAQRVEADIHDHGESHHLDDHAGVQSIAAQLDGELDLDRLTGWLHTTITYKGPDLNRIKAILAIDGQPNRVLLHGVQDYLEVDSGEPWGDQPRRCTIVAIGHDLDQALWQRALEGCRADPVTTS